MNIFKDGVEYAMYNEHFDIIYICRAVQFFPWLDETILMVEFGGYTLYEVNTVKDFLLGELWVKKERGKWLKKYVLIVA